MTTGDDAFARTVDDIVASLRRDPVLVQQAMGNGHTQDAVAEIRERVDAADFPVYVALVHPPAGLEENDPLGDLTSILHQRIGGPGLYVVGNEHGSVSWETYGIPVEKLDVYDGLDAARDSLPRDEYGGVAMPGTGEAALVVQVAADPDHRLSADQLADLRSTAALSEHQYPDWEPYHPEDVGPVSAIAALVATFAALTVQGVVRAGRQAPSGSRPATRPKARPKPRPATDRTPRRPSTRERPAADTGADDVEALRAQTTRLVAEITRRRDDRGVTSDDAALAGECADLAGELAASSDRLDVVGALVLARTGLAAVAGDAAYHCCFFNPLHGEGVGSTRLPDAGFEVPCCRACRADADADRRQDALLTPTWRGSRPYWTRDGVWSRTGFGSIVDDLPDQVRGRARA